MSAARLEQYRVIVYGIGGTLFQSIDYIKSRFDIVGFSDKNESKAKDVAQENQPYYAPAELPDVIFDYIVITSDFDEEICTYLTEELHISREKILKRQQWYRMIFHYSYGEKNPDKQFYVLSKPIRIKNGLMSNVFCFLEQMDYVEQHHMIPVVDMQSYPSQYMEQENIGKENAWEYFFKPVSEYTIDEVYQSKQVVLGYDDNCFFGNYHKKYNIPRYMQLWKKYIHLNSSVQQEVDKEYQRLLAGKENVMGVLFRGTDMVNLKLKDHAIQPTVDEMIAYMHRYQEEWGCEYIYLCTEDAEALERFKQEFGNCLICTDQQRFDNTGTQWLAQIKGDRPNDSYLRGVEYLVTLELLARCSHMLAGVCTGSVCAEIMNDNQYEHIVMIDKGVY